MTTRGVLNILLLLGVIGLALVAFYQPGIAPAPAPVKLTSLAPKQIKRIHIERAGKDAITLLRENGHWRISAPRNLPADDGRVDSLLRLLREPSQARFPAKAAELVKYKLDEPPVKIALDELVIDFGDTDPLNGRRYVRIGDTVHLITDMYYYQLDADPASFVSTRLLPDGRTITALTLPDFTLSRDAQDHWTVQPDKPDISADAIHTLLDAWRNSSALWVKPYEQGKPLGQITLRLDTPAEELHFDIMAREPELVLARPDIGMQYHLSPETAAALLELGTPSPAEQTPAARNPTP